MCPWCYLTPACPCRRGGGPAGFGLLAPALVAVARRLRRPGHVWLRRHRIPAVRHHPPLRDGDRVHHAPVVMPSGDRSPGTRSGAPSTPTRTRCRLSNSQSRRSARIPHTASLRRRTSQRQPPPPTPATASRGCRSFSASSVPSSSDSAPEAGCRPATTSPGRRPERLSKPLLACGATPFGRSASVS